MPKRILHIIPSLDRAGAEKQLVLLVKNLPREEFDIHVCALTRGGALAEDLREAGIPLTVLGKRWKIDPLALLKLRKHVAELKPDMVHTWMFPAGGYGRAAALAAGAPHLVHSERCVDLWKANYQFAIDRCLARRTDRIVANSTGVRDYGVQHGIAAEKFVVIPNGVPAASAATPTDFSREQLLAELDLPSDVHLVGAIGRLWPQKRVKDLIWVAELINILRQDVRLLVIGEGPQRAMLERYTRLMQIEHMVRFLGHRDDVPRIMPHLDLVWLASDYEGMPNSLMEAMSAGKPVVATDIPGNRDLVVPGETGFLVPVGGRAAFTRETEKILNDPALAQRLGTAGRERMLTHFSVEQMVDKHVAMYRQIFS